MKLGKMIRSVAPFLAVLAAIAPSASGAQDIPGLVGIASLTGKCERLVAAGNDFSAHCSGMVLQSIYETGRTGFTVTVGDQGTVVTFSGMEGRKPDADSQLQSVDKVILNLGIEGVPPTSADTEGSCSYRNPYIGPMTIGCHALDNQGKSYFLQFTTDGSEPQFSDLQSPPVSEPSLGNGEFTEGDWVGGPFAEDPDGGCLMSKDLSGGAMLMVYANGNEAFQLHFFRESWALEAEAVGDAELFFDGMAFPLTGTEVRNPQVLTLFGGGEEEGFQAPFESSSQMVFVTGGETITVDLSGSKAATSKLWSCVSQ